MHWGEEKIRQLNQQVAMLYKQGRFAEALSLAQQVVELARQSLGEENPYYAASLNNLAALYRAMGRFEEAEPLLQKAMEIRRLVLGEEHPYYATSLNNLAGLLAAEGRYQEAFQAAHAAAQIGSRLLSRIAGSYPEQQVLAFAQTIEGDLHFLLTLVWRYLSDKEEAVGAALDIVLQRKAIAYEAAAAQQQAALAGRYPKLETLFEHLRQVRLELARRAFSGPARGESLAQHERRIWELERERERLEQELARQVPEVEMELRMRAADREAITSLLPPNSALIEFVQFTPYRFEAKFMERRWEPERFLAFVLSAGEPERVQMVDLGEAEEIEQIIQEFRKWAGGGRGVEGLGRIEQEAFCRLYDCLFVPLMGAVQGGVRHLILAPDGELCTIPFGALLSPKGRYVIEDYLVTYVTVGRDVVRFGEERRQRGSAVIVADPDFDLHQESLGQKIASGLLGWGRAKAEAIGKVSVSRRGEQVRRALREERGGFERLAGTRKEGEAVKGLLERAGIRVEAFWVERQAVEGWVKRVRQPMILHIATHGFFLPDIAKPVREHLREMVSGERGKGTMEALLVGGRLGYRESPLLRSGLVFAGVNSALREPPLPLPEEAEDGVMTAMDVMGMDLMGTELVVLSACQTGVGAVRRGEGVIGLRRAFVLAGARTVVMSLWNVPDEETQWLMGRFYEGIWGGKGKGEALREAQLGLMREGKAHPYYWAAFICQGDVGKIG